ncbi:hypothetical protein [Nannocystis bainbridge]|uniref:Uncharacterized protein n=1 Tax=Nannocystis bainbridge TaxID=2995303 RepID=A0ABT5DV68_9BACT|nr:hypothetical protein [Nannocystis bainbridge]MDC0717521.1 hypothetical protein [Nannocystis bainbridge]
MRSVRDGRCSSLSSLWRRLDESAKTLFCPASLIVETPSSTLLECEQLRGRRNE